MKKLYSNSANITYNSYSQNNLQEILNLEDGIIAKIVKFISRYKYIPSKNIQLDVSFAFLGLKSIELIALTKELGIFLKEKLPATLAFDYVTIRKLAHYLASEKIIEKQYEIPQQDSLQPIFQASQIDVDLQGLPPDSIAVVGMACRFPNGANSPEQFWDKLIQKIDCITEVPAERWDAEPLYTTKPDILGTITTKWGGFIDNVDLFDAEFFNISPREANVIDPQQRLALELSWSALEHAGINPDSLRGTNTGVFIGISGSDYGHKLFSDPNNLSLYAGTGTSTSIAANRISYFLGLNGPSMSVDTACSSSLSAIHLALQNLKNGECDIALAGGVNLILSPAMTIIFSQAHLMAPDGRCKTFDRKADGYVRSEGCGILVLKRLADAMASNEKILCVIRGSSMNQDGQSNGLTVPNGAAQEQLVLTALSRAGLSPNQIDYIEAHGTGTSVGDPIEVNALAKVFSKRMENINPLCIGSVKSNIGHLEQAAGVAGIIKIILAMQNEVIPPNLHFHEANPYMDIDAIPAKIPTDSIPWKRKDRPRIAGVSGFSFGGTNVHMIIQEPPIHNQDSIISSPEKPLNLLSLSAKSEQALKGTIEKYSSLFKENGVSFAEICHTANTGRSSMPHKFAVWGNSIPEVQKNIEHYFSSRQSNTVSSAGTSLSEPRVAMLFTG